MSFSFFRFNDKYSKEQRPRRIRERFPTPAAVARARASELSVLRKDRYPSPTQLTELQQLAQQSIGTKDAARVRGLVFEQKQLIEELSLIHTHVEQLETEITQIVEQSREGKILTSIPGVGTIPAVAIFASIGSSANFQSAPALKAYFDGHPLSSNLEPLLTVRISLHVAPAR